MAFVIKAKGWPFSCKDDDIAEFFEPEIVLKTKSQIHRIQNNGRWSGDIFLDLESEEDVRKAVAKNKQHVGDRFITVIKVSEGEKLETLGAAALGGREMDARSAILPVESVGRSGGGGGGGSHVVQLRGLPFTVRKEEIIAFFQGLEVAEVRLVPDKLGRTACNGEAYVTFFDSLSLQKALDKHKQTIGTRWIEVYKSNEREMDDALDGGGRGSRELRMPSDRYLDLMPPPRPDPRPDTYGYSSAIERYSSRLDELNRLEREVSSREMLLRPPPPSMAAVRDYGLDDRLGLPPASAPIMPRETLLPPAPRRELEPERTFTVRMGGLPFDTNRAEVKKFFRPARLAFLELTREPDGKVTDGVAEFDTLEDFEIAMSKHRTYMRHRYIELSEERDDEKVHRCRMRGLPFECSERDILHFFAGIPIADVELIRDSKGKVEDGFATFFSADDLAEAMRRDKSHIHHRYIDLVDVSESRPGGPRRDQGRQDRRR